MSLFRKKIRSRIKTDTSADKALLCVCYLLLVVIIITTLYPFWDLAVLSISPRDEALKSGFRFFTLHPDFSAYEQLFRSSEVWNGFRNSFIRVLSSTILSVCLTALTAYPLSKKYFPLRRTFTALILFTMIFNGGLIPSYLLIKNLGLIDSLWALILPGSVGAYNLIIMRNFLQALPESLEESAKLDGAGDFMIWLKIVLPLSKPVLATIALWVAVANWNAYLDALIYINDRSKYVLTIILRRILLEDQLNMFIGGNLDSTGMVMPTTAESKKAALTIISILPIAAIYPFLQKYFSKGVMLGAVKG